MPLLSYKLLTIFAQYDKMMLIHHLKVRPDMKRIVLSLTVFALVISTIFTPSTAAPVWNGDADGNGQITLSDVSTILKHIAKWDVEIDPVADFNSDGTINLNDASLVLQYIAKWNVAPDSLLEAQYGVTAVDFEIPAPTPTETVKGSGFGFDTEATDNTGAWNSAIAYLKKHPGTTLEIEHGTYKMAGNSSVSITGLQNCVIDGGNSTFLFANRNFFGVNGCDLTAIKNLTVDWDYETTGHPTTSVVRIRDISETDDPKTNKVEYEFFLVEDASYAMDLPWDSMMHMDPETLTVGTVGGHGDKFTISWWHKSKELTEPNVITAMIDSSIEFDAGDVWLLKHYNYSGPAFSHGSGTNITYENINIYSGPGGGIYLSGQNTHHIRINGVTLGLNPEKADTVRMSTTADALNFKNTGGYIIVENCDVGYQGDDCINIHSTPGITEFVYGDEIEMIVRNGNNFYVGCEVGFKRASDFTEHEFTATVTGYEYISSEEYGQHYRMFLDKELPSDIEENWIIYNKSNNGENYIIRNNYFHENRARGVLLGSPNGLVENNRFYRHQLPPINISIDHGSQWIEGTGVNNLIIRNNVFEECDLIGVDSSYINISAGSDFGVGGMILSEKCFNDILISGNTFINPKAGIVSARSITNLAVVNNIIKNPDELTNHSDPGKDYPNRGRIELRGYEIKDATVIHNIWENSPYISDKICDIYAVDKIIENELTAYGNSIVG